MRVVYFQYIKIPDEFISKNSQVWKSFTARQAVADLICRGRFGRRYQFLMRITNEGGEEYGAGIV